jgi:hypothetical protein
MSEKINNENRTFYNVRKIKNEKQDFCTMSEKSIMKNMTFYNVRKSTMKKQDVLYNVRKISNEKFCVFL